ncbi:M23 family metallopeptidase [Thermomonas brevis]
MARDPTRPRLLRGLLLFLLGGLVGANAMYYVLSRDGRLFSPAPVAAGDAATPAALPPPPGDRTLVSATPTPTHPQSEDSLAGGPVLAPPAVRATGAGIASASPAPGSLLIPVQGIAAAQLLDTFSDARSDNRVHDAIDIMAPAGTPVLAVADGSVEKLFDSERGGITLYQFNADRSLAYYYAHLQGYAPGIAEGQALRRGQVIGYVGSTGNASPDAPHLHFAVFQLGPEQRWWEGTAVNPYPLLGGAAPR